MSEELKQSNTTYGNINLTLGQRMPDTSYYMGVSEDTGTDFFLFIESAGKNKTADVVTFNQGTKIMQEKHMNNETFRGHKYSEFQEESAIIASYKNITADGGIRRLTNREWSQVEKVFEQKSELRDAIMEVVPKNYWVQTASQYVDYSARFKILRAGYQDGTTRGNDTCVMVGRSEKLCLAA